MPEAERARIRTELGRELFTAEYGRAPLDGRELAGFVVRASRQQTTAVAGYDATFTPDRASARNCSGPSRRGSLILA